MRTAVLSAASLLILVGPGADSLQNQQDQLRERARSTVVLVECVVGNASRTQRTATGFLWHDPTMVVTALHVVSGCLPSSIMVSYEAPHTTRHATVEKVLNDADLALLKINGPPGRGVLQTRTDKPTPTEELLAIGYPLGTPTMTSVSMKIRRLGGRTLREYVPHAIAKELAELGSPSLDLEISDIEGHLLPGLSGAPVTDAAGNVVAIGDGGLEHGAAEISWAIPASNLLRLLSSAEDVSIERQKVRGEALFAMESRRSNVGSLNCGGITLTKVRTVAYRQMLASADDPERILKRHPFTQMVFRAPASAPDIAPLDVFEDLDSGATVALPPGILMRRTSNGCQAVLGGGRITLSVNIARVQSAAAVQLQTTLFEQSGIFPYPLEGWVPVSVATDEHPRVRFDGMAVQRMVFNYGGPARPPNLHTNAGFERVVAIRRNVFLGVSVLSNFDVEDWGLNVLLPSLLRCSDTCPPACTGSCGELWNLLLEMSNASLAVDLSTFAIG
jgi:S1-C subfamily serine protease